MTNEEAEALTRSWSQADLWTLAAMAERLKLPVVEVILPLASESKLDPLARNPRDPKSWPLAVGLSQMTRTAAAEVGLIPGDKGPGGRQASLAAWKPLAETILDSSVGKQLYLFENFLASTAYAKNGGKWDSAARIYQAMAAPGSMIVGSTPTKSTVLYKKGSEEYNNNRALDIVQGDGGITYGDLIAAVEDMRNHPVVEAILTRMKTAGSW